MTWAEICQHGDRRISGENKARNELRTLVVVLSISMEREIAEVVMIAVTVVISGLVFGAM